MNDYLLSGSYCLGVALHGMDCFLWFLCLYGAIFYLCSALFILATIKHSPNSPQVFSFLYRSARPYSGSARRWKTQTVYIYIYIRLTMPQCIRVGYRVNKHCRVSGTNLVKFSMMMNNM